MSGIAAGAAIVSGAVALGKGIHGIVQKRKAKKAMEALQRPEYKQSEMLKKNLEQAQLEAKTGMPMEQYAAAQQNIDRLTAQGGRQIKNLQGGLAGIGELFQSGSDAFSQLISKDAAMREAKKQDVYAARTAMAGEEQKAYEAEMGQFQDERGALAQDYAIGQQNLASGFDELAATGIQYAGMKMGEGGDAGAGTGGRRRRGSAPGDTGLGYMGEMTPEQLAALAMRIKGFE